MTSHISQTHHIMTSVNPRYNLKINTRVYWSNSCCCLPVMVLMACLRKFYATPRTYVAVLLSLTKSLNVVQCFLHVHQSELGHFGGLLLSHVLASTNLPTESFSISDISCYCSQNAYSDACAHPTCFY